MKPKRVLINDKMQKGYRYTLTEPIGKNFDPEFTPDLTPKQMLKLGVFGGKYMTDCKKADLSCRRKQRQALLHWAYDSRKI